MMVDVKGEGLSAQQVTNFSQIINIFVEAQSWIAFPPGQAENRQNPPQMAARSTCLTVCRPAASQVARPVWPARAVTSEPRPTT